MARRCILASTARSTATGAGELDLDGEQIPDMTAPEVADRMGSAVRDTIVRARKGDAEGYGLFEPIVLGEWPEMELYGTGT